MSNIYIQEPPTSGKVLLKTTVGDIDIELWAKETPKACRNFVQLCLEGYYNDTIFHRVVKGFIVQGGDPTGTGTGGESIYGGPFKDEFHTRLRFNRRGLIAMANAGKDDNSSQFFFTMGSATELQNKHTIFGKVTGETIYNMLKLEEVLVDEEERPVYPQKIIKTLVLSNPFPDIVPRQSSNEQPVTEAKRKDKKSGVKNFKLLSFGEEAEEDEEENVVANKKYSGRSKSTHDLLQDPNLSSLPAVDMRSDSQKANEDESGDSNTDGGELALSGDEDVKKRGWDSGGEEDDISHVRKKLKSKSNKVSTDVKGVEDNIKAEDDYYLGKGFDDEKKKKMEDIRKQIKSLKRELNNEKQNKEIIKIEEPVDTKTEAVEEYVAEVQKYKTMKQQMPKKGQGREEFTLALLSKFQEKLANAKENATEYEEKPHEEADANAVSEEDEGWLTHKLQFEEKTPVLAKDASTKDDDWFEIYDPRNPINKRRREASKNIMNSKERRQ